MNVIQLGPFILNVELLIFLASSVAGYLALQYRLRSAAVEGDIANKFVNALIIGFFTWKFSPIIFDPVSIIQHPISLLYFNGGDRGIVLAITLSILYLWIRTRKDGSSITMTLDVMSVGWIAGSSVYHLLTMTVDSTNVLFHSLYVVVNVMLVMFLYYKKEVVGNPAVLNRGLTWYSLGMIAIFFTQADRSFLVMGFTKEQIFFFIVLIIAIYTDYVFDKKKRL